MRLRPLIAVLVVGLTATVLVGCSRKAERLVGADRLIRGPGGLGTTTRVIETPDRDTYVENGTAVFDSMLLVGQSAGFEARTFLLIGTVNLPDTTLPGFVPQILSLEFQRNLTLGFDPTTVNAFQTTVWDTTTVSWAGPAPGTLLGSASDDRVLTGFSLPLNSTSFTQVVQWKVNPVVTPPRIELLTGGQPLAAYAAGTVKLRIRYSHTVSGSAVLDSIDSPVTQDFYLHSPLSPAPSGADSALVWGGLYQTELAMHFPLDSIPSSVSVNEATLVLRLSSTTLPDSADVAARVFVKAIRSSWGEGVSEQSNIPAVDSTAFASGSLIALYSVANGTVAIRLPGSLMREWVATPSTNGGLLVRIDDHRNLTKRFLIGSRESTQPAELHVSYTELPPGRL